MQPNAVGRRPKVRRHREVNLGRVRVADLVGAQRAVVGHHSLPPGPQRPADQAVGCARWPLGQPEDPPVHPLPVAVVDMELPGRVGVPDLERLRGREVSGLGGRERRGGRVRKTQDFLQFGASLASVMASSPSCAVIP